MSEFAVTPSVSVEEAKVLYALLDAADEAGRLPNSFVQQQWNEAKTRLAAEPILSESAVMWELLEAVETSGSINSTWIQNRWCTIKRQVERESSLNKTAPGARLSHTPPFFAQYFR